MRYGTAILRTVISISIIFLVPPKASGSPRQSCNVLRYIRTGTVGGERYEYATRVRSDSAGRIITGGVWGDTGYPPGWMIIDFDPTDGVDEKSGFGGMDSFLMVTHANGSYAWTNTFGGIRDERIYDFAVSPEGHMVLVGTFSDPPYNRRESSVDFDPGPGEDIRACPADSICSFITRYAADGRYLGTLTNGAEGAVVPKRIEFDTFGNMFVMGTFYHGRFDFNPRKGEDFREAGPMGKWFITKILSNKRYGWTIEFENQFSFCGIALDVQGNLYMAGSFDSRKRIDFDPGPGEDWHGGDRQGEKAFVARINADLSYGWTRMIARSDYGDLRAVDLDVDGDGVYVAGGFSKHVVFDPDGSPDPRTDEGSAAWLVKITTDGEYRWVHAIPGDGGNSGAEGVSADGRGNVYFTGSFAGNTNFDPDGKGDWQFGRGNGSTFVTRLGSDRTYHWTGLAGGPGDTRPGAGVEAAADGRILIGGYFESTRGTDFDPTDGEDIRRDRGGGDVWVSTWLCNDCDALLSHGLWVKGRGVIVSRVNTNLSAGRVELRLTSDDGGVDRTATVRLRPDGRARARFDELPPGRYDVQIQWIDDASVARLCDGPLMERAAVVR